VVEGRPVLFSCKISHSILTYLDRQGADLMMVLEGYEYPTEFLRNPSHWLDADKMEQLLSGFMRDFNRYSRDGHLIQESGHACRELRSWGVLDSVLRMMASPKDLFAQPDRLLSYFVSPAPPIGNLQRDAEGVSFASPITSTQYPLVTEYLRSAMEALPTYSGRGPANVRWQEADISINWQDSQESLLTGDLAQATHYNPETVRNILSNLEAAQKQIEDLKRQLAEQTPAPLEQGQTDPVLESTLQDFFRLNDYWVRAQQLISMIAAQTQHRREVQEAMRRLNWTHVQTETGQVLQRSILNLQKLRASLEHDSSRSELNQKE